MAKNVAELVTDILHATGVKRIYGVVGDSLNGITESLRRRGDIDWVHVRHEETAAFAAGAEAALTGELAVCAGSCGPGNLHLINGLYDCQRIARSGAGDRGAYSFGRNRPQLLPGNQAGQPVPRLQSLLRTGVASVAASRRARVSNSCGHRPSRRCCRRDPG